MPSDNIGIAHFLPVALATGAICFGSSALINCRAVEFPAEAGSLVIEAGVFAYRTKGFIETPSNEVYVVDVCRPYTDIRDDFGFDYDEDNWMQTLERLAYTIPILGGIALIGNCISVCKETNGLVLKAFGVFYVACAILQGLGLKILDSFVCTNNPIIQYIAEISPADAALLDDECQFGMGVRLGITATVFWAVAGLASLGLAFAPARSGDIDIASPDENTKTPDAVEAPLEEAGPRDSTDVPSPDKDMTQDSPEAPVQEN